VTILNGHNHRVVDGSATTTPSKWIVSANDIEKITVPNSSKECPGRNENLEKAREGSDNDINAKDSKASTSRHGLV
jgi:hypothetical protein